MNTLTEIYPPSVVANMSFDVDGELCFREAYVTGLRQEIARLKTLLKQGAASHEVWINSFCSLPGTAPRTRRLITEMRKAAE